jgi:abortive infection bacteriophage resistance protein
MRYAKPPLTFEAQVDLLFGRGIVGDRATMVARLSTVNYYRLSAYWYPFRLKGPTQATPLDRCRPGTSFEQIWETYGFDQKLRLITMEAVERIEVAVRTQLAYHHAHAWSPDAYATNPVSLPRLVGTGRDRRSHSGFLDRLTKIRNQRRDDPFVRHFGERDTSSDHMPIWMATELMSIGDIVVMYGGCRDAERDPVAMAFGVTSGVFASWLGTLQHVRNICAHHGRLWNRSLVRIPKLPPRRTHPDWFQPVPVEGSRIFTAMTLCAYLLKWILPTSTWATRVKELIDDHPSVPPASMGFPPKWRECPLWAGASADSDASTGTSIPLIPPPPSDSALDL